MKQQLQASGVSITRRTFLGFFALGSILSRVAKKFGIERRQRAAMFWRKRHD